MAERLRWLPFFFVTLTNRDLNRTFFMFLLAEILANLTLDALEDVEDRYEALTESMREPR